MSGRIERGMDDDATVERRQRLRRREDAALRDDLDRLKGRVRVTESVLSLHRQWFEDMGVERMSEAQRRSLPTVLESVPIKQAEERNARTRDAAAEKRFNRRVTVAATAAAFAGIVGPYLHDLITAHHL